MRLTRSQDDVVVSGVLAGLGEYFNIDPTLLRIGFVVLVFLGIGLVIPIYIAAAFIIPKAPREGDHTERFKERYSNPRRPRRPRRPKRPHPRDYASNNKTDNHSSSNVNDVDEEDWSDF